jgi:hypothetical protein
LAKKCGQKAESMGTYWQAQNKYPRSKYYDIDTEANDKGIITNITWNKNRLTKRGLLPSTT